MAKEAVVAKVVVKEAIVYLKMALTPPMSPVNLMTKSCKHYKTKREILSQKTL